jgi:hypothetical protein
MPIAIAAAFILNVLTVFPLFPELVYGATAELPAIALAFSLPHFT